MKKYLVSYNVNAGKLFKPAEYIYYACVMANNKKEALTQAQSGNFSELLGGGFEIPFSATYPFRITTGDELSTVKEVGSNA